MLQIYKQQILNIFQSFWCIIAPWLRVLFESEERSFFPIMVLVNSLAKNVQRRSLCRIRSDDFQHTPGWWTGNGVRICFLCLALEESVLQKAIFRHQTLILIISEECLSICVKLCCSTRFTKNLAFLVVKVAKSKKPGSSSRKSILALFVLVLLPENVISHMEVLGKSA